MSSMGCIVFTLLTLFPVVISDLNVNVLRIYHQNDIHSHFGDVHSSTSDCSKKDIKSNCYGGFSRAVAYVKEKKKTHGLLNLNAGDFFQGHPLFTIFGWKMVAEFVSLMPYDALALGESEFSDGIPNLLLFMRQVGPKFVCTNLNVSEVANEEIGNELRELCPRSRVFDIVGHKTLPAQKVAVLGYTTPKTILMSYTGNIRFEDEVTALTAEVGALRKKGVKIFVALGHSGLTRDIEIAKQVPSLDVVVGGHSHTLLWEGVWQPWQPLSPPDPLDTPEGVYPTLVTQANGRTVLVVQAYQHGKYLGGIDIGLNKQNEVDVWWPASVLLKLTMKQDPKVVALLNKYEGKFVKRLAEVAGNSLVNLVGSHSDCCQRECTMGSTTADSILWANQEYDIMSAQKVCIAIFNCGGLRQLGDPIRGPFMLNEIHDSFPFLNSIIIVNISGDTLTEVMERSVSEYEIQHLRFLQVSGLRVVYDVGMPPGKRVKSLMAVCATCHSAVYQPVQRYAMYEVAITGYVGHGGDEYDMLNVGNVKLNISWRTHNLYEMNAFTKYSKAFYPMHPQIDGRITILNNSIAVSSAMSLLPGVIHVIIFIVTIIVNLFDLVTA